MTAEVPARKRLTLPEALRIAWAQLTSMRTALLLLFVLAVVAIPGSLIPQRTTSPLRVRDFARENPDLAVWYDRLGLFDVYGSPWFAAVYLLLFVSLVGCIVPRIRVYARAVRTPPPRTPRNLQRLAASVSGTVSAPSAAVLDAAAAHLRRRRYRVTTGTDSVSAERGYLREAGNLVFHLSLVVLLSGLAWTSLLGYRGTAVIVERGGFSNTLTQYDELSAGPVFDPSRLEPFTLVLRQFHVRFETGDVQRGAARDFRADVTVTTAGGERDADLQVNHPLTIGGTEVHLLGHGYAPVVTVTDASGNIAYSGPVVFLPQDGNFSSSGVIKAPDARPDRMAFEGLFLPTAVVDERGPRSVFPDAFNPELFLNAWHGAPKQEDGTPENVYTLDTEGLTQYTDASGSVTAFRLAPGETFQLPAPGGSIKLDGWQRWVKVQVSQTPGTWLSITAVAFAMIGLCLSLFVRPRRLWLRVTDGGVEAAGLDKAESRTGLDEEVTALFAAVGGVAATDTTAKVTAPQADAAGADKEDE